MIPLFSPEGVALIDRVAADRALLAFDFDGTLAPTVPERGAAEMRAGTRALLQLAAVLYPCAVLSGRARTDLARRLVGVPTLAVVGNHGAEPDDAPVSSRVSVRVRAWAAALEASLSRIPGVEIEVKGHSLSVHHRGADPAAVDGARIAALAASLPGARVFAGEQAVNVVPVEATTKAAAVEALVARERPPTVMYVGDDATDEDAFRSPSVTFPLRVGRAEVTAARYFVEDQRGVDDLLRELLVARARHAQLGDGWRGAISMLEPGGDR